MQGLVIEFHSEIYEGQSTSYHIYEKSKYIPEFRHNGKYSNHTLKKTIDFEKISNGQSCKTEKAFILHTWLQCHKEAYQ